MKRKRFGVLAAEWARVKGSAVWWRRIGSESELRALIKWTRLKAACPGVM
jgi:hypothetical protein